jgi:lipoyl-dependent peroxiredoxin subunit D
LFAGVPRLVSLLDTFERNWHVMEQVNQLRESLPDAARDIKINLTNVLTPGVLDAKQTWGTALACAYASRNASLVTAVLADARAAGVPDTTLDDAKAAAVLMAMNNVYYRFRHAIGKDTYSQRPARLRMMRTNQVADSKPNFDLFCLAVSSINFCEVCMQAHEKEALEGGLSEDQVHDSVRLAATINAAAVALESL